MDRLGEGALKWILSQTKEEGASLVFAFFSRHLVPRIAFSKCQLVVEKLPEHSSLGGPFTWAGHTFTHYYISLVSSREVLRACFLRFALQAHILSQSQAFITSASYDSWPTPLNTLYSSSLRDQSLGGQLSYPVY